MLNRPIRGPVSKPYPVKAVLDAHPKLRESMADMTMGSGSEVELLASRTTFSLRTVERWLSGSHLSLKAADAIACALDTHIGMIWPDIYWPNETQLDRVA